MGEYVKAFSEAQIWVHKHLIHFTAGFIISGLPLLNKTWFGWIAALFGAPLTVMDPSKNTISLGMEILRWIHRISAIGLAIVLIPYFIYELFHLTDLQILPECLSIKCLKNGVKDLKDYYIHKRDITIDRYNAGQKIWAWLVIVGLPVMYASGLAMWFRDYFSENVLIWAHLVHDIGFYIAAIMLSIHVYLSALIPEHRPMLDAMFRTGMVPLEFIKKHHIKWFKRIEKG